MVTTKIWYRYTCTYPVTLNVLATTDDFMNVDRKAFETAVWEALESLEGKKKKNQLFFSYIPGKQPVSRNQFQKIRSIVVVEE